MHQRISRKISVPVLAKVSRLTKRLQQPTDAVGTTYLLLTNS